MLARHSGFNSALLMRGTEGWVTPSFRKRSEFVRYCEQSEDVVEADPSKIGIEQENRLVPIAHALMPIIDREFGPDENNAEIAKLTAKEGLAAIGGKKCHLWCLALQCIADALAFGAL